MSELLLHTRHVLRENPVSALGFALLGLLVLLAAFGPLIAPHDPLASNAAQALSPPSRQFWLGTDQLGRDILSRIIVAARLDLGIAAAAATLAFVVGTALGLAAGYCGGWTDRIISRITDTIMAFPLFVLAMGIVAALGNSVANVVYATAIIGVPLYARLARVETHVRREAGYVAAARLSGNSELRIVLVHILPNIMPIMAVQASLTLAYTILNVAGLSFIGLGVRPPAPEWGIMVAEGASAIISGEWWIALFPGLALMLAVFSFNLMGDGLRDIIDPRMRT
jgi:peptide/nickel transport system permease protein